MKLLDLTLASPAENLALDEALLDAAEADPDQGEVLRLWEPAQHFVVVGRSSKVDVEVSVDACRQRGVPILRRSSGGAAVVAGPGCLMYGVLLSYHRQPQLRMLDRAHDYVLAKVAAGLRGLGFEVQHRGTSDLVWGDRKISGNSLRCKRDHFLYHGTLLYNFDLPLIGQLLRSPPRQPEYRRQRPHDEFVANLPADAAALKAALAASFATYEPLDAWPRQRMLELADRQSPDHWSG